MTMTVSKPATARTQVKVVHAMKFSFKESPKDSLIIQKPASLTCPPKTEPAPTASTISAAIEELAPNWCGIGANSPAAVIADTDEDPNANHKNDVNSQAATSGEQ